MVHQLAKRYRIRKFCVRLYEKVQAADDGTPFKENKLTIGEIALQIGYQNPNKFTSAFRTEYGMSPTEYRKKKTQESLNG